MGSRVVPTASAVAEAEIRRLAVTAFGYLPLHFTENRGQFDERVAYAVHGGDTNVYFTANGLTFTLTEPSAGPVGGKPVDRAAAIRSRATARNTGQEGVRRRWAVRLDFVGVGKGVRPTGGEPSSVIRRFSGPRLAGSVEPQAYTRLTYSELWPGIDLVYAGTGMGLKSTFVVKPGADPGLIRLAWSGTPSVTLAGTGELVVSTPVGELRDAAPEAWQDVDGRLVAVATAFSVGGDDRSYGFRVGPHDPSRPLVLDPVVLMNAGYLGGSGGDGATDIAVDAAGHAHVVGSTDSSPAVFPTTVGWDLTPTEGFDAFVAKITPDGTDIVYMAYVGGTANDFGDGLALDPGGNVYIVGRTASRDFPVVVGPDLTYNGGEDAFVAKLDSTGTRLIYAGFMGGGYDDEARTVAVDGDGLAYVAGKTASTNFPVAGRWPYRVHHGRADAFLAKISASGGELVFAGFLGGGDDDEARGVAVDGVGEAYLVGATASPDFPVADGWPHVAPNGDTDAFVVKLTEDGTRLIYGGYLGGTALDEANAIAVDQTGSAYLVGFTASDENSFPATGLLGRKFSGWFDAFVAKVEPGGRSLEYAGYIGGSSFDEGNGIAVDRLGGAYVVGFTNSDQASLAVVDGPDLSYNGGGDTFVAKIEAPGALLYLGYIGGSGFDDGNAIAVDGAGDAYVVGFTESAEDSFPVIGGPDQTANGRGDAFVARVGERRPVPPGATPAAGPAQVPAQIPRR